MEPDKKVSVIVPTYNEEGNILALIRHISHALTTHGITFEIIVIDDHSTDNTLEYLSPYCNSTVRAFLKKGKQGKAFSIIEGIAYARYETIAMIDADLQYTPYAIPKMIEKIHRGAGVVVAKRNEDSYGFIRRTISQSFAFVFGRLLHGLRCDVQSGLKVFKKEIFSVISLHPTPWTFDLEFLTQARDAGYAIASVPIDFKPRKSGESKVNLLSTSYEIGSAAVKLKFRQPRVRYSGDGFLFNGKKYSPRTKLPPQKTAFISTTPIQKAILLTLLGFIVFFLAIAPQQTLIIFMAVITFLYLTDSLFNLFMVYRSLKKDSAIAVEDSSEEREWPPYTIFCPLYREWQVLPQFVAAMSRLNYPADKLQVILLLEENDKQTIEKIRQKKLPGNFEVVIVPHSQPKTKPKALNYGLNFARGKYSVVYDAEDVPDPMQLKKAVRAFEKLSDDNVCMQAKLNFFNVHQNILTRLFTAEYSLWFDLILPGLQSIDAPIPLGGTSNHFPTAFLRSQTWDAFNVTEDCDLGMRLFKSGYRTQILDSTTYEEANSDVKNWINQRSRWIKGYIQTYLVHMRDVQSFKVKSRTHHLISFQYIVGGKVLSMFINPIMWLTTIAYFTLRPYVGDTIESLFIAPVLYMGVFSLVMGNFFYMYYYMIGSIRRNHFDVVKYTFLIPFYWLGMSIAAWAALYSLIVRPHYWAKTVHGLHFKQDRKKVLQQLNYAYSRR